MGRKKKKQTAAVDAPPVKRAAPASAPAIAPARPADISLPPWLAAWLARHGAGIAVCGLLVILVAIVFGQTLGHDFIDLDDSQYVFDNPHVRDGLSMKDIVWAFTERYEANWHPLTWISHMLDWEVYGRWAGGHHLTSLLLHAATAIVLFLALRRMTGTPGVQRPGGGALRHPSLAGGVGGLGAGAERRVERTVLHAHALGVCGLCAARPSPSP